jgi:hypothetical protein
MPSTVVIFFGPSLADASVHSKNGTAAAQRTLIASKVRIVTS